MYSFVWLELSSAKSSEYDKWMNFEAGFLASDQAINDFTASSVLPYLELRGDVNDEAFYFPIKNIHKSFRY